MAKMALVLGGGAPNCTLMTGAMLAFDEAGVKFDVYSGAGGGGAMALLYLSPNGLSRRDNLKNSVNLSISDAIFDMLPVNYRVFQKGSGIAGAYRKILSMMPGYSRVVNQYGMTKNQKLMSDMIQLVWALTTPSTTNFFSNGLCAHAPIMKEFIDFDAVRHIKEEVYLNSYSVDEQKVVVFDKTQIDFRHFGASLGYPFFYESAILDGKCYMEGGAVDSFNFQSLLETDEDIRTLVVLDAFGNKNYIQRPRNLWQAYCQSMILPLVEICRKDLLLFEHYYLKEWNAAHPGKEVELIKVQYDIPQDWLPSALDWSEKNMQRMFDLGYDTAQQHIKAKGPHLGRTIF